MSEYIHINKAVRKYNKTRQTFYNYIKKGFVKTKKVNNKVYLLVSDIENLLNDFISTQTIIEPHQHEKGEKQGEGDNVGLDAGFDTSSTNKKGIIDELQDLTYSANQHIRGLIDNLHQDINKQLHNKHIGLKEAIENKIAHTNRLTYENQALISQNNRKQGKILFWMYYLVFVSINIFILRYIS